jgi:hypothetical protein
VIKTGRLAADHRGNMRHLLRRFTMLHWKIKLAAVAAFVCALASVGGFTDGTFW